MNTKNDTQYAIDTVEGFASRTVARLIAIIIVLIIAWACTVGAFIWYLYQYDFTSVTTEYTQDGEGLNIMGDGNGDVYYGPEKEDNQSDPQP